MGTKALFTTTTEPTVTTVDPADAPSPGQNSTQAAALIWDPDAETVFVNLPNDVQAGFRVAEMADASEFVLQLTEHKLGARIRVIVEPATPMPKFASVEEAEAWLEANS